MTRSTKKRWIVSGIAVFTLSLVAVTSVALADYGRGYGGYGGYKNWHKGCNQPQKMDMIRRLDPDADGRIPIKEAEATRRATFQQFDANGDKLLSLNEFRDLWLSHNENRMVRRFQKFDDNADGKITEQDFLEPMMRKMSFMDRNGDGVISREDRRGWRYYDDNDRDDDGDDRKN